MQIEPNLEPSVDLAYILGVLKGDGWVYSYPKTSKYRGYRIGLNVTSSDFANEFEVALRKIGLNPNSYIQSDRGPNRQPQTVVSAHSKTFVEWYRKLTLDDIEKIVTETKDSIIQFIRGFYESEGTYFHGIEKGGGKYRYERHRVIISNKDKQLLLLVKRLLKELGFKSTIPKPAKKGKFQWFTLLISGGNEKVIDFLRTINPVIKKSVHTEVVDMMFALRREVLERLLADPEWSRRLEQAKTFKEAAEVIACYAEKVGLKVVKLK